MKKRILICLQVLFMPLSALLAQQTTTYTIVHDGLQREYILYVPASYASQDSVPLLFNFHGFGGTAQGQMEDHDFRSVADTAGFIIAHPQGTSNGSGPSIWNIQGDSSAADDIGFTEAMIDSIASDYNINRNRVYATGKSLGGFFSVHLAGQISGKIAAIASVSGTMIQPMFDNAAPLHPMPFLQIHGTADPLVPYNGNAINFSVEEVLDFWVDFNNCDTNPSTTPLPDLDPNDGSTVEHIVYDPGDNGVTVEHFKIIGGRHTWPGSNSGQSGTNFDIDASEETWLFFSRYDINGLIGGAVGTDPFERDRSSTSLLPPNYPNPFRSQTTIPVTLPQAGLLRLSIFDSQGKLVKVLVDEQKARGEYSFAWDATDTAGNKVHPGSYIYRFETPSSHGTRTMTLLK